MSIKIKQGVWYDSDGRQLTEAEKAEVKKEVFAELDKDLADKGFEGLVKKFAKYLLNKDGKGLGKYVNMGEESQTVFSFSLDSSSDDLEEIQEELDDVVEEIEELTSDMEELAGEMQDLASQLEVLQAKKAELEKRRQTLMS